MFALGKLYEPQTGKVKEPLQLNSKHLMTHAVCVGMTGSGKTGLGIVLLEEAALNAIPSIIIDPKGDMGNILLTFPDLSPQDFQPWIDPEEAERKGESLNAYAEEVAKTWKQGLEAWGETPQRIQELKKTVSMVIYTPASNAGVPLSILHSFDAPSKQQALDSDALRERVLSTTSSLLGLLGIVADPIKSREHILISTIISEAWKEEKNVDLAYLIGQVQKPEFDKIGVLDIDTFFPAKDRLALSVRLNNLLAAPGFQSWMEGVPLDIQQMLYTAENKPKVSIISIAHLNDAERMFFVTLLLNQLLTWMRKQPGTSSLRALLYMDEIFGYFPPTAAPPSKVPMLTLLKQARAYGLGMMLCTQNPVDLDYKGLSNCGVWFIGRLQTARDRSRVVEGLTTASNGEMNAQTLDTLMSEMGSRTFIMRSIYEKEPVLFQTRWTLSYLRGPLTLAQIEILMAKERPSGTSLRPIGEKGDITGKSNLEKPSLEKPSLEKPSLALKLPQYFVRSLKTAASVIYQPFIAGFSKLHFVDKKYNVDEWVNACQVVGIEAGKVCEWPTAESHPDLRQQLAASPLETAAYEEIPSALLNEKKCLSLKQELLNYLYQNNTLNLFEYKELKLLSKALESEADFRQRVLLANKEREEEQIHKVREEYNKKITVLKEKIRKAEEKKNTRKQKSFYQKIEAFFLFLTTLIGAFFGKKLTKTTINQAGTTLKRIGRVGKDSQDVTVAEESLQMLEQQLQEVTQQLEEEIASVRLKSDASTLKLDEVTIRPRKTDITIDEIALIWWPK